MPYSVGQRLKHAREERNLSVEKAEQLTRIRAYYIQALEADDYSVMSSAAQARGFLRNYSEFLGLNIDEILVELQRVQTPIETEQISGPLPIVDNASSPPVLQDEEKPARPSLISLLTRFRKSRSASEMGLPESISEVESVISPEPVKDELESPQPREHEAEIVSDEPKAKRTIKGRKRKAEAQEIIVEPPAPAVIEELVVEEANETKAVLLEEEAKPSFMSRLGSLFSIRVSRPNQPEEVQETVVGEPISVQVDEVKVEVEDETPQIGEEQAESPDEAGVGEPKPNRLARVIASVRARLARPNFKEEVAEVAEVIPAPMEDKPELPEQSAEEIFAGIGAELRKRRDLLSLTAEEVERHTRLRAMFVTAMEDGLFDKLPSPVQTRGMLANYATFLDLDADALLLRFADALQARHRVKYPDKPAGSKPPAEVVSSLPFLRSYVAGDLIFGVLIVAVLFALAIWGVQRMIAIQTAEQILPTAPSIPEILAGTLPANASTPTAELSAALTQNGTALAGLPTLPANVNIQLNIVAMERTFMRVIVDGDEKFNGRVLPGTAYPYVAERQIEVLTGNGSALRVTYNGRDLGLMGAYGEVVDRVYTAVGIATPTATLSPTPTNTPLPSPTLSVTGTPTPALTPTITVTP